MTKETGRGTTHQALPRGIAIIGADGSGKTNLFERLQNHFGRSFVYINSVAGQVIRDGYPLGKDASKDSYIELNRQYVALLSAGLRESRAFMSDRSLIDAYCYARANKALPRPHISDAFIAFLREQWLLELNFVEMYILCSPEFDIEDDGVRETDKKYQSAVSDMFGELLREAEQNYGIRFIKVHGKDDERQKTAIKFITEETGVDD